MARDELVTIAGAVRDVDRAPYVDAVLDAGDVEQPIAHRSDFDVAMTDGARVTIELAKNPVVWPERRVTGAWKVLREHPVQPTGEFHPDGRLALRGTWIAPGEQVCVIGYAKAHDFVPDTGTHREAPERRLSLVRAIAIGVGETAEDAANAAKKADAQRARDLKARAQPKRPSTARLAWLALGSFALAAILAVSSWRTLAGFANLAVIFGLLFVWCALPTSMFPGGAVDAEEVTEPGIMTGFILVLLVPCAAVLAAIAGDPVQRSGLVGSGWLMLGLYPLASLLRGLFGKPRALPGAQVKLPTHAAMRWLVVLGLVATWIAALVLAIPHVSADGPMT